MWCFSHSMILRRVDRSHRKSFHSGEKTARLSCFAMRLIGVAEALQVVREIFASSRLTADKPLLGSPSVPHVHDIWHANGKGISVLHHAGERNAAHVDAVIGALARNETLPPVVAAGAVIGHADFQRRIN